MIKILNVNKVDQLHHILEYHKPNSQTIISLRIIVIIVVIPPPTRLVKGTESIFEVGAFIRVWCSSHSKVLSLLEIKVYISI
jgi:hypothetical protein